MARILVVDDEAAIRAVIAAVLEEEGHDISHARDGAEALAAIQASMPDLIVLDLAMPGMDGWHLLEELHNRGLRKATRVVIVSAHYDPATAPLSQRRKVGHFLPKPFEPDALIAMVDEALAIESDNLYDQLDRSDGLARLLARVDEVMG